MLKKGRLWGLLLLSDRKALARAIAARTKPRFIETPRERGGAKVPFTEEQLNDIRGGVTAENIGGSYPRVDRGIMRFQSLAPLDIDAFQAGEALHRLDELLEI